ncbi:MAG TPA: 3-phosphoshikimate 1-carboxyvinyltransferase [Clostridiales bacterium]|nr:3-phosphoshikimate 1-carboxyvinyltransferase [Clostridiales bacterium]
MDIDVYPVNSLNGEIRIPGDKSIAHRAVILNSIGKGTAKLENFPMGKDCLNTIDALKSMGTNINLDPYTKKVVIEGVGLNGLTKAPCQIYAGNSGTTARLLIGLLAGQPFSSSITGDKNLRRRPMDRIVIPLSNMKANIHGKGEQHYLPVHIEPARLHGIDYILPVASAQVKSAILLAALYASSPSVITEVTKSRNHTEIMLKAMGATIDIVDKKIYIEPEPTLYAQDIYIPGDISSAAFMITAGLLVPNSTVIIRDVGLNTTRSGILDVYMSMGGDIHIENIKEEMGELKGDIRVTNSKLNATTIQGDMIPRLIDEIPIIALAATQATGTTIIKDAQELTIKESNRILSTVNTLTRLGANIEATSDGMIIEGPTPLYGNVIDCAKDHRIAMMAAIGGLIAIGKTTIKNSQWIDISFPGFFSLLKKLSMT